MPESNEYRVWSQEFTITCTLPQDRIRQTNHSIQIDLDGKKITLMSNVLRQSALYENKEMKFSANYTRDYATFRNFQFGSLELTGQLSAFVLRCEGS